MVHKGAFMLRWLDLPIFFTTLVSQGRVQFFHNRSFHLTHRLRVNPWGCREVELSGTGK